MNLWQLFKEQVGRAQRKGRQAPKPRYIVEHKGAIPKQKRTTSKHEGAKRHPHGNRRQKRNTRKRQKLARRQHRYG